MYRPTVLFLFAVWATLAVPAGAQTSPPAIAAAGSTIPTPAKKPWYELFQIKGYAQVRYNRLLETNDQLKCESCDKSWGDNGGIFIRRARLVITGQIHPRVFMYMQSDFAGASSGAAQHLTQIRDWYFDVGLDGDNEFRLRLGQSKVPFGYDNLQSSQNRLPLDRSDAINSAAPGERDLGVFLYWAPKAIRGRFKQMVDEGTKGSGDYGVLGFGAYNGQSANRVEANDELHVVARLSYPFLVGSQVIEPSVQAYTGNYVVTPDQRSLGVKGNETFTYEDRRVAGSIVLLPKPFGVQAEYNVGKGPEFNPATDSIEVQDLSGGYITVSYRTKFKDQVIIPFVRAQIYDGGKKNELDARSYDVEEIEFCVEWMPMHNFEFTAEYVMSHRRFQDFVKQDNDQSGRLLRLQAQLNF